MGYIIIDIDGVLNPFDARYSGIPGFSEHNAEKYHVFLNPEMHVKWLNKFRENHTLIWGSAWAEKSNLILQMLGIDDHWEWIPLDKEDVGLGTWKIKSIRRWVETLPETESIVWLDDELEGDAHKWSATRGNMLTINPDRYEGLTEKHFQTIDEFLNNSRIQ